MALYMVECEGRVREVYAIEAESMNDAMERWDEGTLVNSESSSVEPVNASLEEEN